MNSEGFGALVVSAEMLIKVERGERRSIRKVEPWEKKMKMMRGITPCG